MNEERRAVVTMYEELKTRHLRTGSKRLDKKTIELRVRAKHCISRATLYRYLAKAAELRMEKNHE